MVKKTEFGQKEKFSLVTFFSIFIISFFIFSILFLGVLSVFPYAPRVAQLFDTLDTWDIPIAEEFSLKNQWIIVGTIAFAFLLLLGVMWLLSMRNHLGR